MVCFCGRREPGLGPAADSLFFASPKKSKQKKGDPQSATPSRCYGANLRRGACGVRRGTRFAAAQRRSDSHGESDDEAWAHGRPCHPATAPPQAQPAGAWTAEQPNSHTGHCCAWPSLRSAWRLRPGGLGRAQQWPVWMSGFGFPSGCAEERSGQRIRARDCLSAVKRSEFERDPAGREHRRLPEAKRRDAACRVAFSLVTFFWRSKGKLLARRATPGLRPQPRHEPRPAQGLDKLNPNGWKNSQTIKTIATSA